MNTLADIFVYGYAIMSTVSFIAGIYYVVIKGEN